MDIHDIKRKGRPPKKNYDEEKQMAQLLECVDDCFTQTGEIKATAEELGISSIKVKKLLITSGKLEYEETKQIQRLLAYGKKLSEVQQELGLKKSSINSYLPYSKVPYKENEISANADRCDLYRKRRTAIEQIRDGESLWKCITLFQKYKFYTIEKTGFIYEVEEHDGDVGKKRIIIDREDIVIPYSDILDAYNRTKQMSVGQIPVIKTPEDFCGWKGSKYLYSIFYRFGLIEVPEAVRKRLRP